MGGATAGAARFDALTGLRFVAAFHVVAFHFLKVPGPPALARLVAAGYVGVGLFFVLSGFILTVLYGSAPMEAPARRAFWAARLARIAPAYLVGFALAAPFVAVAALRAGPAAVAQAGVTGAAALVGLQAWTPWTLGWNYPAWSVSVEAFFYAGFPALARRVGRFTARRALAVGAAACAAALLAPAAYLALVPGARAASPRTVSPLLEALKFTPVLQLPLFVLGMATGRLFVVLRARGPAPAWMRALPLGAAAVIAAALGGPPLIPYVLLHNGLLGPAFAALVLGLAAAREPLGRLLATRPLVLLGEASYALYIIQDPLYEWWSHFLAARLAGRPLIGFALFAAALLGASLAVYRWVEVPARAWLRARLAGTSSDVAARLAGAR